MRLGGKIFKLITKIQKNLQAKEWGPLANSFHAFLVKIGIELRKKEFYNNSLWISDNKFYA